jgi:uncharacterized membrane protein YdjX (TVP38/TMEM64 family)
MPRADTRMQKDRSATLDGAGRSRLRRLLPIGLIAAAMVLVFAMGWHRYLSLETLVRHRAALDTFVHANFCLAVAAFIGVYVLAAALSIPGAVFLTIAGGILFGWLVAGAAAIVGATIGASIIFLVARTACGESALRRAGPTAAKLADGFHADAFNYLLFLRLIPVFPFWLVNLVSAVVGVRFATFVLATGIGIIPGTFAYALVGHGLDSVIAAQATAYRQCVAAGRAECHLDLSMAHVITPQLIVALVALGLVALVPIAVRKWRARMPADKAA